MHASADRRGLLTSAGAILVALSVTSVSSLAQNWIKVPAPSVPRKADGTPNLFAPAPRGPDGKPDLTGPWSSKDNTFLRDIATGMNADAVPFQPWARALFDQRRDGSHSREPMRTVCRRVSEGQCRGLSVEDDPDAGLHRGCV